MKKHGIHLRKHEVINLLNQYSGYKWDKINHQSSYVNMKRNVIMRQMFAIKLIDTLRSGKILISFDETTFQRTCNRSYSWVKNSDARNMTIGREVPNLHLFLAVFTSGELVFRFMTGINN